MKITKLLPKAALLIAIAIIASTSALALTANQAKALRKSVLGVPVPEMGAKAAELVLQAEKQDRETVAVTLVRAIVFQYKSSAASVVASISEAAPEVAPAVAAAAAELSKGDAVQIASAAATAAPEAKKSIAASVAAAVPASAPALVPSASPSIASASVPQQTAFAASSDAARGSAAGTGTPSSGDIHRNNQTKINGQPFSNTAPNSTGTPVHKDYNAPR